MSAPVWEMTSSSPWTDWRLLGGAWGAASCEVLGRWYLDKGGLDTTGGCGIVLYGCATGLADRSAELVPGLEGRLMVRY